MKPLLALTMVLVCCGILFAEDYSLDFEIPQADEEEQKGLEWSGYLDSRYFVFHTDQSSPLYQLQFLGKDDLSELWSQYKLELYLDADYQTSDIGFHLKTHSAYYSDSDSSFDLFEAYGNVNLSLSSFIQAGKRRYNWGKGYAFNPVGYVNPYKDPENPELAQAGLLSMNFEKIKSFDSEILKTITLTTIIIPPDEILNKRYAEIKDTDLAAKLYLLLWNMDIDVMGYYSRINASHIGFDFATNIKENIEIHGELSHFRDEPRNTVVGADLVTIRENGYCYLMGLRYLNQWRTTVIAEYYHNGIALNKAEYASYIEFVQNGVDSLNPEKALNYSRTYFRGANLMRDYLYLKITQPEPFNWLYFTPSMFTIYNLNDNSLLLAVSLSYKPFTNFEVMLWPTLLIGDEGTEFGSRQLDQRCELRMKVYY
jgi:hypothetical protein